MGENTREVLGRSLCGRPYCCVAEPLLRSGLTLASVSIEEQNARACWPSATFMVLNLKLSL